MAWLVMRNTSISLETRALVACVEKVAAGYNRPVAEHNISRKPRAPAHWEGLSVCFRCCDGRREVLAAPLRRVFKAALRSCD